MDMIHRSFPGGSRAKGGDGKEGQKGTVLRVYLGVTLLSILWSLSRHGISVSLLSTYKSHLIMMVADEQL